MKKAKGPSKTRAKREYRRREARRRLAETWNQPKPGGWFDRLLGIVKGKKR